MFFFNSYWETKEAVKDAHKELQREKENAESQKRIEALKRKSMPMGAFHFSAPDTVSKKDYYDLCDKLAEIEKTLKDMQSK